MIKRILVPIDASKCSFAAADYAIGLAKVHNAAINLIHVVETHPYYSLPYYLASGADKAVERDIEKTVEGWFAKIGEKARKENVTVRHDIIFRSKAVIESIISYADQNNVDLIVIGTRGLTTFKRLLVGSVARGVIDHAHCPVLLVK